MKLRSRDALWVWWGFSFFFNFFSLQVPPPPPSSVAQCIPSRGGQKHWCICKSQTNSPSDRVGWHVSTPVIQEQERQCAQTKERVESQHTGKPDPHARALCSRCRLLLFPDSLPTTPDNSHCRWHSTLTSVQLYWCSPGGIPSVNREFSTGTPCCKRDELHNAKI